MTHGSLVAVLDGTSCDKNTHGALHSEGIAPGMKVLIAHNWHNLGISSQVHTLQTNCVITKLAFLSVVSHKHTQQNNLYKLAQDT